MGSRSDTRLRADGGDCLKWEERKSVPEGTRETEASSSQGEIQISRMTVRLNCERGEVKKFRLSKTDGERKVGG
jgi:hypothetical protein